MLLLNFTKIVNVLEGELSCNYSLFLLVTQGPFVLPKGPFVQADTTSLSFRNSLHMFDVT